VKFAEPALTRSDIEVTKGRAARSGRSHGGVPLQGNGGPRNSFNYSSSNQNPPPTNYRQSYTPQNGYKQNPIPPPGWQPPPPGIGGFGRGPPPPPPSFYGYAGRGAPGYSQPPRHSAPPGYGPPPPGYGGSSDRRRGVGDGYGYGYGRSR
jgi:5'-3' exoribonuclease 2